MNAHKIMPVSSAHRHLEDTFWSPRLETSRRVTLPYVFKKCEETGRVDNFLKAAGAMPGEHQGLCFNDSDVYKAVEGASYALSLSPGAELERYLDGLIAKIAAAQEEDGYLYTARSIDPGAANPDVEGPARWSNLRVNHELYNLGHLYEAAVAHYRATGKRSLLEVALKSADLVDSVFGPEKRRDVPGHQEIELGLVKLYGVTGEERYLELAKFFLDERGHANGRPLYANFGLVGYMQDHLPVHEQREAVGHAVRAGYMYSAMADVALLTGDRTYIEALDALWDNVVSKKLYLTGGIGSRHEGEAFGDEYELPNLTAYNETCAAIANIMWNQRMFLLHGEGKYLDVLERTLYNGFLAGISLTGTEFFYVNPLASNGTYKFNLEGVATRSPWFSCSCCPTNVVRFLPALPGYVYAQQGDTVYVNLFCQGSGSFSLPQGEVEVRQETDYPWEGRIRLTLTLEHAMEFTLALRIPGWARNEPVPSDLYRYLEGGGPAWTVSVNSQAMAPEIHRGFAWLQRTWHEGDTISLELPMPVRRVVAHEEAREDRGRVAVQRGPLVYCAEAVDNAGRALDLTLQDGERLTARREPDLLGGMTAIHAEGITLIPYYAWSHRGEDEMAVWLARR